ncbi:hypothetical protein BH23BAC1_BH23BAC1_40980 [soil metagenome]
MFYLAGCDPNDETPIPGAPVVTFENENITNGTYTGVAGEVMSIIINVNAPAGFNTLIIRKAVDGAEQSDFTQRISRGQNVETNFEHEFTYELQASEIGSEVVFTIEAVDEQGLTRGETLTLVTTGSPAVRYTSVLLFAPLENQTSQTFFSTNTGETYSMADVLNAAENISTHIDFGYFYGQTREATLASPAAYPLPEYGQANWIFRNETLIGLTDITPGQYVEITEENTEAINQAFEGASFGANRQQVSNLAIGEILAFETDNNKTGGRKRGLIQVQTIQAGTGTEGSITIEVLVEQ